MNVRCHGARFLCGALVLLFEGRITIIPSPPPQPSSSFRPTGLARRAPVAPKCPDAAPARPRRAPGRGIRVLGASLDPAGDGASCATPDGTFAAVALRCVSGKPPSIPPHLLPPGSAAAAAVAAAAAAAAGVSSSSSASSNSSSTSISMTSGGGVVLSNKGVRTTATVPPLGLATPLAPLTTSAGAGPPSPTSSSSFAAALRSLAKQATAPPVAKQEVSRNFPVIVQHHWTPTGLGQGKVLETQLARQAHEEAVPALSLQPQGSSRSQGHVQGAEKDAPMPGEPQRLSPKVSSLAPSSTSGHLGLSGGSAPPVVTIAPTHAHGITSEAERSSAAASEDLVRGFQPYRAPDVQPTPPAGTPGASLRPPMPPLDLPPSYPPYHPSLYPHHLAHQYRLEEHLYLERYGLLRPPLSPYGVGGLSGLYPGAAGSPYLSARFPPDLLPTSLAALHPSSALLHERKRVTDAKDCLQVEAGGGHAAARTALLPQTTERSQTQNQERSRDRSPIAHAVVHASAPAVISVTSLSTSSVTITSNSHSRKNQPIGVATQQVAQPLDIRSSVTFRPINDVTFLGHVQAQAQSQGQPPPQPPPHLREDPLAHRLEATKDAGRVAVKPRTPAIVRRQPKSTLWRRR
ncbi:mucin-19-like [Penaeus indicus]|uniref:mucin-19-like n=1 Tax=Penaeus indicus TaxID=29960 RepID=UPI00300CAFCB